MKCFIRTDGGERTGVIREVGPQARGVFCGAAGVVLPGVLPDVPIRIVTVRTGTAISGVGRRHHGRRHGRWRIGRMGGQDAVPEAGRPRRTVRSLPRIRCRWCWQRTRSTRQRPSSGTRRRARIYGQFAADTPGIFDTLWWNERGEVTEFARGNAILELASVEKVTPPLQCGLLHGVGRACELAASRVREAMIRIDELSAIRRIWFVDALRGLVPVYLRDEIG